MRLFLAIELAPSLQAILYRTVQPWRALIKGKWVEKNNLHITIGFVGETPSVLLPGLINNLTTKLSGIKKFNLTISNPQLIPLSHPRLIALKIIFPPEYVELQRKAYAVLKQNKLFLQMHAPHLTLVRLKSDLPKLVNLPDINLTINVSQISLMQSQLTPKGPIYKRLKALKLTTDEAFSLLRPNIAICVLNPKNELLLIRSRRHNPKDWQFPQGGIEQGESLINAALRELSEEVGITNVVPILVRPNIYKYYWSKRLLRQPSGHSNVGYIGQVQSLAIVRVATNRPQMTLNPIEATASKWVKYQQLLKSISPARQGLGKIAMVELDKIINNNKTNG